MVLSNHRKALFAWILVLGAVLLIPSAGWAHPHVFIEFIPELIIEKEELRGLDLKWTFDRFTSEMIIDDVDQNRNGQIDEAEMPNFDENYRSVEVEANFFLQLYLGKTPFDDYDASLQRVYIANNLIRYQIEILFREPLRADRNQTLLVEISDPEIFVAFSINQRVLQAKENEADSPIRIQPIPNQEECFSVVFVPDPSLNQGAGMEDPAHGEEGQEGESLDAPMTQGSLLKQLRSRLFTIQGQYNRKLGDLIIDTKERFSWITASLILAFSFLYGMLHALGPGHGKSVVIGYFLQRKANPLQVIWTTLGISTIHTGSAVLLAVLFQTVLSSYSGMQRIRIQAYFSWIIALFILLAGIALLIHLLLKKRKKTSETLVSFGPGSLWILSAGLIPCPLSITILLIAVSHNILLIGLLSVVGISAGMMGVLTLAGLAAMTAKSNLYRYSSRRWGWASHVHDGLELGGAVLIILFGFGLTLLYMPTF